jgi:hypothetical protein
VSASDYAEEVFLKLWRGNSLGSNATAPAHIYAKLHVGDPGEAGTANPYGTTGVDISRPELSFTDPTGTGGTMSMTGSFTPTWTSLLTGSVNITYISLWDASTGGNCIGSGALVSPSSVAVNTGDTLVLTACTFTCD